ncbi:HAT family dimerization domain-containing protein [Favolaschia claudopus]|uniref:HAT family dimerization domain-containing protein n=1 Tax=Favolaschia claudopus TaxID=2862362 RepID=A0AAW0C763_9AGAR
MPARTPSPASPSTPGRLAGLSVAYFILLRNKVPAKKCFFTGNVSARRTHISRNPKHFEVYKRLCEKNNVPVHPRATPKDTKDTLSAQSTLDHFASKIPQFTSAGLLDHLVELMVTEDNAFLLVDKAPFRRVLQYSRPSLKESDIPHRTKMRAEVLERASEAEDRLRARLSASFLKSISLFSNRLTGTTKSIPGQVSFTFYTWTSKTGDPFFGVTGHYIDSPPDSPEDWSLKSDQLAYTPIEGNHSGDNLAKILVRTLDRYDLREKMGWGTADNASNNDTCMKCAGREVDPLKLRWDPVERRVRCMEHSVHLAAKHFITRVSPISAKAVVAKAKKLRKELKAANPDLDDDEIDALLAAEDEEENEESDEDNEGEVAKPKDALGKALALVKQVRASPQAQAFFKKMCAESGTPVLQLLGWIRTRWASMFTFLDRLILLRPAVSRFVLLADDSPEVPNLVKKSYVTFRLSRQDWDQLAKIHEVLQEPANIQQSFSSARHPTVWRTLPLLEALAETWRNMAATERFADMRDAIYAGLENVEKWYPKTDDTDVYFICLALDPNIKTAYAQDSWNSEAYEEGLTKLESVFDTYYVAPTTTVVEVENPVPTAPVQYGYSWIRSKVQARKNKDVAEVDPHAELKAYLDVSSMLSSGGGIMHLNPPHFPAWHAIIWPFKYLQPLMNVRSPMGHSPHRNRLAPEMFEALQLLKSAYRNGHISASEEARNRVVAALDLVAEEEENVQN